MDSEGLEQGHLVIGDTYDVGQDGAGGLHESLGAGIHQVRLDQIRLY